MASANLRILMKRHPIGNVREDDFQIVESPIPSPADGEVLVRNEWLSLDPYMRLQMDARRSYAQHLEPGQIMPGGTVGKVISSRSPELPVGAQVVCMRMGWQSHGCMPANMVRRIDALGVPPSTALSVVGMPGVTAHYGLLALGRPKPGDTVVVSAAAGAVGSIVGQIAKMKGCRAVGIAGGAPKCRYVVEQLGFDACVDYHAPGFEELLAEATPDRVDVDFENVGGTVMDAVLSRLDHYARVVLCGVISQYDQVDPPGLKRLRELLVNRASLQAFIISEHPDYWPGALSELAGWVRDGRIKYREDVTDGLVNAPKAFMAMLTGRNFGKQLVRISENIDR